MITSIPADLHRLSRGYPFWGCFRHDITSRAFYNTRRASATLDIVVNDPLHKLNEIRHEMGEVNLPARDNLT
jgi:hypothetical protein